MPAGITSLIQALAEFHSVSLHSFLSFLNFETQNHGNKQDRRDPVVVGVISLAFGGFGHKSRTETLSPPVHPPDCRVTLVINTLVHAM